MSLYDDASLILYPSGYKEDKIYSLKPTDGSGDLTFTRASTATRVNADGLIETSPVNLLLNTDTLSSWSLEGGTLTSGQTDPNGGSTAFKYVQITGGIYSGGSSETSGSKTATIWLKSVSGTSIACNVNDGNAGNVTVVNVTGDWQLFTVAYTTPTSRPSLYIYSISNAAGIYIWHPQLNTGSTAKPYFPTTDRLDVPRIDYTGGGCGKLLLEPQRTNLALYSEQFDNGYWVKTNTTVVANSGIAPNGTTTAELVYPTTTGSNRLLQKSFSISAATPYTGTWYLKASGLNWVAVDHIDGSVGAWFNLSTGTIGTIAAGTTASIENVGNGWYRCRISKTSVSTTGYQDIRLVDGDNTTSVTANGTDGLLVWGAQLELGSYPTSYIPTTTTAVTRTQDTSVTTGLSSVINSVEGVAYFKLKAINNPTLTTLLITISDGSNNNNLTISYNATGRLDVNLKVGGAFQFICNYTGITSTNWNKIAVKYKANDFAVWVNGTEVFTDAIGSCPSASTFTDLAFGAALTGATPFLGQVQNLMLFPSALSDTQLATLTTL